MILADSHLDTTIEISILMNVLVPKLEYAGEAWEGNPEFVKQLKTVQTTDAKNKTRMLMYDDKYSSIKSRTGNGPTQDEWRC